MSMGLMLLVTGNVTGKNLVNEPTVKKNKHTATSAPRYKKGGAVSKELLAALTKNIEYDFGKTSVRKIYYDKLNQLAEVSIDNKYALSLRGFADSIGTYKGNWVVSDRRAKAVKSYLVTKGVDSAKIVTTPFGSTKPIASNKTKTGRQRNRRVEIKINEVKD